MRYRKIKDAIIKWYEDCKAKIQGKKFAKNFRIGAYEGLRAAAIATPPPKNNDHIPECVKACFEAPTTHTMFIDFDADGNPVVVQLTQNKGVIMPGYPGLGSMVKHIYTPFKGVVVSVLTNLHGTSQHAVQPQQLKNGIPQEPVWLEYGSFELLEEYEARMAEKSKRPPIPDGPEAEIKDEGEKSEDKKPLDNNEATD